MDGRADMRVRSGQYAGWRRQAGAILALVLVGSAMAHAHDFWIEPSAFRASPATLVRLVAALEGAAC